MGSGTRNLMAYEKAFKWQILNGSLVRRLIFRGFMFGIALAALPLIQFVCNFDALKLYPAGFDECRSVSASLYPNSFMNRVLGPVTPNAFPHLGYSRCNENVNLTVDVVRELLDRNLLNYGSRALCLGPDSSSAVSALRELGFSSVDWVYKHPFFGRKEKEDVNHLNYQDNSFDFLIARDLDKVSIPALIVIELERVLKPGGIGAVVLYNDISSSAPGSLIRSTLPVSTYLKSSNVIHVASLNPNNTLVVFKKKFDHGNSLVEHRLPADCPSLRRNQPYLDQMEPLVEAKPVDVNGTRIAYLPEFLGITSSSGRQLVYVDMGKREVANFSHNNWFLPSYPIDSRAFNVYIVDHNALVLSSHVQKPGVNFIYHPGLSEKMDADSEYEMDDVEKMDADSEYEMDDVEEIPMDEAEFDFLSWFKETVAYSDLVVFKMNAGRAQLKFLYELYESDAICAVDELFLECSDSDFADGNREAKLVGNCMDLFKKLRSTGLFVHQWWSN